MQINHDSKKLVITEADISQLSDCSIVFNTLLSELPTIAYFYNLLNCLIIKIPNSNTWLIQFPLTIANTFHRQINVQRKVRCVFIFQMCAFDSILNELLLRLKTSQIVSLVQPDGTRNHKNTMDFLKQDNLFFFVSSYTLKNINLKKPHKTFIQFEWEGTYLLYLHALITQLHNFTQWLHLTTLVLLVIERAR